MGIREVLAAKADEAKRAASTKADEAKVAAAARAGQARESAAARVRDAGAGVAERSALARLLGMDDDLGLTIERLVLLLVVAVRASDDEVGEGDHDLTEPDVLASAKRRYRRLGTLSLPAGPAGGALVNLYCDAATLCDVVRSRGLALRDEVVAAHLLVLWGAAPDVQEAADAVSGRGPGVASRIAGRVRDRVAAIELPDPMTKRAAIVALWRLRDITDGAFELEGTGLRERVFPGRRVRAFIARAHAQLDGPAPRLPAPDEPRPPCADGP